MILGIDCSRYGAQQKTGVELYTDQMVEGFLNRYEILKGLDKLRLYVRSKEQEVSLKGLLDELELENVEVVYLQQKRLWTLFGLSLELWKHPIDLLFVPSHTLPLVLPKKSVLTVHGVEALSFPEAYTFQQRWYQWFSLWWAKRKKAHFIAVSQAVKKDVMSFVKVPQKDIEVVWNGYTCGNTKSEIRNTKKVVQGRYLLSVGRLEKRKNQLRLVKAFEMIASDFPDLQLVLVGSDGNGAEEIHGALESSPVKDRVVVAGYQHHATVQALMASAEVFAYPSLAEGFGIPILEAFDVGVPVLTSKGSACEEVAGDSAVFCDPLSVEDIADKLRFLLKNERLRKQLVRDAQKRLDLFSWEKCVQGTLSVLQKMI